MTELNKSEMYNRFTQFQHFEREKGHCALILLQIVAISFVQLSNFIK